MVAVIVTSSNCNDPINLKTDRTGGLLVVSGKVSTLPGPYTIALGLTVDVNQTPSPLSGASVAILASDGTSVQCEETSAGKYTVADGSLTVLPGLSYQIDITLSDGKHYKSIPEMVQAATGADAPFFEFERQSVIENTTEVKRNVVKLYTNSSLPQSSSPQYFKWDVEEVYMFEQTPIRNPFTGAIPIPCFVGGIPDPQRINIFSTENVNVDHLDRTLIAIREVDQTFLARHYFVVNLSSISLQDYTYWKNADALINRTGSIFDTPPAPIRGNIYNVNDKDEAVYGFFEATVTSTARVYTLPNDLPFPPQFYCNDPTKGIYSPDYPSVCHNCLALPNSSHIPPVWWF
jgi:hypothetical protein